MDAYILVGDEEVRKSSVLRSLTGCYNENTRDIEIASPINSTSPTKVLRVYARVSSLQEKGLTESEFEDLVSDWVAKNGKIDSVVFCLWSKSRTWTRKSPSGKRVQITGPTASGYIKYLQSTAAKFKWKIVKVAVLGNPSVSATYPNQANFPLSKSNPINVTAQDVRRHFNWV